MDYNNKLKLAKEALDSGSYDRETIEYIFPELKESEDEKIRKELKGLFLSWINGSNQPLFAEDCNRWLAWLEKQGKNNMGISEATKQKLEDNLNKALEKETPESCNKFLDEQGEQKSFARYKVGDIVYYDSFGRLVSFVIANIVEDGTDNPMYEDKDGNSVFQNDIVEQKPVEWRPIDNEYMTKLCEIIDGYDAERQWKGAIKDWLKSLSPQKQWKPSEEQMEALANALSLAKNCGEESAFDLRTLYEQLKKLMEE